MYNFKLLRNKEFGEILRKNIDIVFIGLTLFALFFGAGNLVLPVMLGQYAGEHSFNAGAGFVCTGVMLPFMGVVALGVSGETDFLNVAKRVGAKFGLIFTTVLYLTIGPFFAMPRTGTVSYEIAVRPFVPQEYQQQVLYIFLAVYFVICFLLSINPGKIVSIVGKFLTPVMLAFLFLIVLFSFFSPMGQLLPSSNVAFADYAFFEGFRQGYQTMDALASFVFGIIIIYSIAQSGVNTKSEMLRCCVKASVVGTILLSTVYMSLTYIGATSVSIFGVMENGGQVLAAVSRYYFGSAGNVVLGLIVLFACLTTSVGLVVSCSNFFHKLMPGIPYIIYAIILSLVSYSFACMGLSKLLSVSAPVLAVIYPATIMIIICTYIHSITGNLGIYKGSVWLSLIFSILYSIQDMGGSLPPAFEELLNAVPFAQQSMGWVVPALAGLIAGYFFDLRRKGSLKG